MKKILFMLPSLGIGGMERVQVTIANALAKKGFDVTVMTFDEGDTLASEFLPEVHFVHKLPKYRLLKKIPIIRYYFDDGLWETRAKPEQLHRYYVGNEKYDVEIAFFRGRAVKVVSGGAKNRNKTKHIVWVHSDFRRAGGVMANFHNIEEVRDAYQKFDKVVCVSEEAKHGFIETIGDTGNLVTIYNMLPVEEIRGKALEIPAMSVPKAQLHLTLIGRLFDSVKGQKRLIDVVIRLHDEGKSISLALVGGGGDEQMLRNKIDSYHAEGYITLCGSQMNPYPFIKESDLLVCASYFEGYNLAVAEALILGTPVLSTECTGPNEILDYGKYGKIVENSEERLYCGIKEVAENPELLKELQRKAAERQDFFDEKKLITQIEELF